MDVGFSSAKPQTLVSSLPLSPSTSSHFHLPSSIRRDFLGCGAHQQLRPPGLRSRRARRKLGLRIQPPPRCLFHDAAFEDSVLVVAVAVAAFASVQLLYLNYATRRRESPEFPDQEVSGIMVNEESCKQETDIINQEAVRSESLGNDGHYAEPFMRERESIVEITPDNVQSSDKKDAQLLKFQKSVLASEEIVTNEMQPDYGLLAFAAPINVMVKTSETTELISSPMTNELEAMEQVNFASKVLDQLPGEQEEAVTVPYASAVVVEPTLSFSTTPMVNRVQEINQDKHEKELCTTGAGDVLASSCNGHFTQMAKEHSDCNEEKQPKEKFISALKSLSIDPSHSSFQNKSDSYCQSNPAPNGVGILSKGYPLSAEGRAPTTWIKEGPESKGKVNTDQVFTRDIGRKFMYKHDSGRFSSSPQKSGSHINDAKDPTAYLRTYSRLLRDLRLKDCVDLLERMERKGLLDMDKVHHSRFLKACKSQKAVSEAFRFCKLISKPTLSTYNMLLSVCASSQDFDGAFQVMLLVKEAGFKPDCKLYTTLISTCAKSGKVDAMFEVFHEMVNAGVDPNVNTYGALIDGCARAGQVAKAFGAYGIMSSKRVQPDRVVFNALITACGQSGAVHRAFDVLAEMRAEPQPIDPDHVTVGALMKTCIQGGQVERVREVYKMLHQYGIKGSPDVYTIAVNSCSQTGDLEFALSIYGDMKSNGVIPDEMFFSTLVDVAGHAGNVDVAFEILQDAKAKGIKLGNITYSSLMGACCNAKNWQKALQLYKDLKTMKLLPTVSTLNALVTSLCDGDQLQKSVEILHELKEAGLRPNIITYSILIVACEKKDETELGFMLLSQAKSDGILPNLIMCRCLTGLCLRSFEKACFLGEPIVTFNSGKPQIDTKWTSWAIKAYRETISAGVIPTIEVFSQVLGCLQFPHDSSLRDTFVENSGINFDAPKRSNICSLLDGFGEYDTRSFSVLEEAASLGVVPCISFKESPIVVDARKLLIHTVEVYLLTILKGLKHRLAAGAKLPNITILLPVEKTVLESSEGERTIYVAGRVGQAVCSLLRRLGIQYQGDESYGKIRINGLTLRRWFKPNLTCSSVSGRPADMIPTPARLAKGIADQQRHIRSSNNLSLEW